MTDDRAILEARARVLARPFANEDRVDSAAMLDVLVIRLASQTMMLTSAGVLGIVRGAQISPLPRASRPVMGLAAWRGRPLTVMALDASASTWTGEHRLVVLGDGRGALAALLVDDVEDAIVLDRSTLTPPERSPLARFALGVSPDARLVLDAARILEVLNVTL